MFKYILKICSIKSLVKIIIYAADQISAKTINRIDDFLVSLFKDGFKRQRQGLDLKDIILELIISAVKKLVSMADNELSQKDADEIVEVFKKRGMIKTKPV